MDPVELSIMEDLQGLARAIRRNLGLQAGYSEHCHPERNNTTVTDVTIYVEVDGRPRLFLGSSHPMDDAHSLAELREAVMGFITERKQAQDTALDGYWESGEREGLEEDIFLAMERSS